MKRPIEIAACLHAAYEPADPERRPIKKSRTLREAIARMEHEACELEELALGNPPMCHTIKTVGEGMTSGPRKVAK